MNSCRFLSPCHAAPLGNSLSDFESTYSVVQISNPDKRSCALSIYNTLLTTLSFCSQPAAYDTIPDQSNRASFSPSIYPITPWQTLSVVMTRRNGKHPAKPSSHAFLAQYSKAWLPTIDVAGLTDQMMSSSIDSSRSVAGTVNSCLLGNYCYLSILERPITPPIDTA